MSVANFVANFVANWWLWLTLFPNPYSLCASTLPSTSGNCLKLSQPKALTYAIFADVRQAKIMRGFKSWNKALSHP
jgi:hypothetical protein